MYDSILRHIQGCVLRGDYYLTFHAEEEMIADRLIVYDVESVILSGHVVARQHDKIGPKYVIAGQTTASDVATVAVKLAGDVVVITIFLGTP
jgi:hypothetical protein